MTEEPVTRCLICIAVLATLIALAGLFLWTVFRPRPPLIYVGLRPAIVKGVADISSDFGLKSSILIEFEDGRLATLRSGPILGALKGAKLCVQVWESKDGSAMQLAGTSETSC